MSFQLNGTRITESFSITAELTENPIPLPITAVEANHHGKAVNCQTLDGNLSQTIDKGWSLTMKSHPLNLDLFENLYFAKLRCTLVLPDGTTPQVIFSGLQPIKQTTGIVILKAHNAENPDGQLRQWLREDC